MRQDNNVIPFPKDHAVRVRVRTRATQQKAVLALSILSVLMLSVVSNQWLARNDGVRMAGRGIASVGSSTMVSPAEVKWEHELANQLSESHGLQGHLAERPSLRDELVFGALGGRYEAEMQNGRVSAVKFVESRGQAPVAFEDRGELLRKYRGVFAVDFADASYTSLKDGVESWSLLGPDKAVLGHVDFSLDEQGRVTSMVIQK